MTEYELLPGLSDDERKAFLERGWFDPQRVDGYVYALQSPDGGPVKIGSTFCSPRERLQAISREVGRPLRAISVIGIRGDVRGVEKTLHRFFASDRLHGEWFAPSERLLATLKWLLIDTRDQVMG